MADDRSPSGESSFLFQSLKRRAQWLQRILYGLVALIPLLPPSVFFVTELQHRRASAQNQARHVAFLLNSWAKEARMEPAALIGRLQNEIGEIRFVDLASITVTWQNQKETIRLREPSYAFPAVRSSFPLPPSLRPLETLHVQMDSGPLLMETGRIFSIHLLVAFVLGLAIRRLSIRTLHHAIHQLEATQAQLIHSEKLSALGEIHAGLAHEINNPLGIIIAKVELLLEKATERNFLPELTRDLEMVKRHCVRIAEIVRSLLVFTRKASFKLADAELNQVVREVVILVEKPFAKQGIRVVTLLDPALPQFRGNPGLLQQVFLNLLNNARDAMPKGGTVTVRTHFRNGSVVAEVEDTGTGLSEEARARAFEPFFTTKGVGKGTGLGLSVSYGIVKSHGGDIEIESRPGHGALFRVRLPMGGPTQ